MTGALAPVVGRAKMLEPPRGEGAAVVGVLSRRWGGATATMRGGGDAVNGVRVTVAGGLQGEAEGVPTRLRTDVRGTMVVESGDTIGQRGATMTTANVVGKGTTARGGQVEGVEATGLGAVFEQRAAIAFEGGVESMVAFAKTLDRRGGIEMQVAGVGMLVGGMGERGRRGRGSIRRLQALLCLEVCVCARVRVRVHAHVHVRLCLRLLCVCCASASAPASADASASASASASTCICVCVYVCQCP